MQDNPPDRYAVIGNPIAHSKSPEVHAVFARLTGESISYERILSEKDAFRETAAQFFNNAGKGLNVTLPFKEDASRFVDELTDYARHAGAVNTIVRQPGGGYLGANTDGIGLLRDLHKTLRLSLQDKSILIIGAGGAARGIIEPLLQENPAQVVIANRTVSKALDIVNDFHVLGELQSCSLDQIPSRPYHLVLHTTSAALQKKELPLPVEIITPQTYCYDLLYGDEDTPFMQWCKDQGARNVADGFGMLLEQAAEAFYLWRGMRPDTTLAKNHLRPETQHDSNA